MKRQYFKPYNEFHLYRLKNGSAIFGKRFAKNAIMCTQEEVSSFGSSIDFYVCEKFPKTFKGSNPMLTVWTYDEGHNVWDKIVIQNVISKKLWAAFVSSGRKTVKHEERMTDADYAQLMKHDRVQKGGSGSRINTYQINNPVDYKQVTSYAYWANMDDARSGNASVVASHIYN